jgi:hypothetical protein
MQIGFPSRVLACLALFFALVATAPAANQRKPQGFERFAARYVGGYSLVTPAGSLAGPARISIRSSPGGRTGRVIWTNTFYTERGSYNVTIRWSFRSDGKVDANTADPRTARQPGAGHFVFARKKLVSFTITPNAQPGVTATGKLQLIGGGALGITVTLTGLPEGDVTYGFTGGRVH